MLPEYQKELLLELYGFDEYDFDTHDVLDEDYDEYAHLSCVLSGLFQFEVESNTVAGVFYTVRVTRDLQRVVGCECVGNAKWQRLCKHWKRINLVLQRRRERLGVLQQRVEEAEAELKILESAEERGDLRPNGAKPFKLLG